MRLVILSDFAEVNGGSAKVAITSARGLAERGWSIRFVHATGAVSPLLQHPNIRCVDLGIPSVWDRPSPRAALDGVWNRRAGEAVADLLDTGRGEGPALVHAHQWTKALTPAAIAAARHAGAPVAVSLHDYFIVCPNGAFYNHHTGQRCPLIPMSRRCVTTHCDSRTYAHKAVRVARQIAVARATGPSGGELTAIHVSDFARRVAAPHLPAHIRQAVVPNPVDVPRGPWVDAAANRPVVYVGRLTPEKGVVALARAASAAGAPVVFMGEGPEAGRIRAACPAAEMRPWGSTEEVAALLAGARALAFPSTWYETSGLVVAEALARGVPAIVSETTAAADLIAHGRNGLRIPTGDEAALRGALLRLRDDAFVERMSREAYARYWRAPPDVNAHLDRTEEVYAMMSPETAQRLEPAA